MFLTIHLLSVMEVKLLFFWVRQTVEYVTTLTPVFLSLSLLHLQEIVVVT